MMTLVLGGSGSGKSAYAENLVLSLSKGKQFQKYYLATMQVFDEEGKQKVERHRMLRAGKGFITVEQPADIGKAVEKMEMGEGVEKREKICLLECVSNLTANEMFSEEEQFSAKEVTEKIVGGIGALKQGMEHVIVVTNNVFEDGIVYAASTTEYIRALGQINRELAAMAEEVVEVVAGIPVVVKKGHGKERDGCI